MANINIRVNQKIEIIEDSISYKSNIQDLTNEFMLIDMPISGNKYYTMHAGSKIEFFTANENEILKCSSTVLGRRRDGNVFLAVLSYPEIIGRVQRREYFRLPLSMKIKYYVLQDYEANYSLNNINESVIKKLQDTFTVDISGGGLKIVTRESCRRGAKVLVLFDTPEKIIAITSAIRSDKIVDDKNYRTALRFESLAEKDRDKIIHFIFEKHREQTKLLKKD